MFADREETIGACLRSKGEKKIWQGWQLLSVSAVEWRSRNRFAVPQHRFFMRHSSATWHLIATTGVADILAMELKGKMMRAPTRAVFSTDLLRTPLWRLTLGPKARVPSSLRGWLIYTPPLKLRQISLFFLTYLRMIIHLSTPFGPCIGNRYGNSMSLIA